MYQLEPIVLLLLLLWEHLWDRCVMHIGYIQTNTDVQDDDDVKCRERSLSREREMKNRSIEYMN